MRGRRHEATLSDLTQILNEIGRGEDGAAEKLLPLVYAELRKLAASRMARERSGHKHDATSLVHEAYLRLAGDPSQSWDSRGHFFSAAAEAMRRIMIDNARRRQRIRHGGARARVPLDEGCATTSTPSNDLLALDEALNRFAAEDPGKAQLVKLRYFGGLSLEEIASTQGISPATAKRHWAYARAWLYSALSDDAAPPKPKTSES